MRWKFRKVFWCEMNRRSWVSKAEQEPLTLRQHATENLAGCRSPEVLAEATEVLVFATVEFGGDRNWTKEINEGAQFDICRYITSTTVTKCSVEIVVNTCLRIITVPWCFHSVYTTTFVENNAFTSHIYIEQSPGTRGEPRISHFQASHSTCFFAILYAAEAYQRVHNSPDIERLSIQYFKFYCRPINLPVPEELWRLLRLLKSASGSPVIRVGQNVADVMHSLCSANPAFNGLTQVNATGFDPELRFLLNHRRPFDYQRQRCSGRGKPSVNTAHKNPDSQSHKPDNIELATYTQLAASIASDSGIHTSTNERRLQSNKPYNAQQLRTLLARFKMQSSAETSLMEAPPNAILPSAVSKFQSLTETPCRSNCVKVPKKPNRRNFPQILKNSQSNAPKGGIERATSTFSTNCDIKQSASLEQPSALALSETWHTPKVSDTVTPVDGYSAFELIKNEGGLVISTLQRPPEGTSIASDQVDFLQRRSTKSPNRALGLNMLHTPDTAQANNRPSWIWSSLTKDVLFNQKVINALLEHSDHCVLAFDFSGTGPDIPKLKRGFETSAAQTSQECPFLNGLNRGQLQWKNYIEPLSGTSTGRTQYSPRKTSTQSDWPQVS
ncbi:hypothetical protein CLF_103223 [Clonorchis sinensis]|uniref:Uncharacterized protein n=1 Tax=Clonorchis sinensis TaxID=79923 RepID=G7Y9C1_CLOSI|nr:hypothetical protein CLF_103223 [Clonorchis sinensis]